jgi:zinc protease
MSARLVSLAAAAAVALLATACCPKRVVRVEPIPASELPPAAPAIPAVDRSALPAPAAPIVWAPPAVETWRLSNGMQVWLLTQEQAPLVSLTLQLPNGSATDPAGKAGLTALTVDLLDEGAGERDALQLGDALQRLATDYGAEATTDTVDFSMDLLADQLSPSLALLADIVRRPRLPEAEFKRRKAQRLAASLAGEANPTTARSNVTRRVTYGSGYGAFSPEGIRSTLAKLTFNDVRGHYRQLVAPAGASFVVVGAVDRATLTAALEAAFGDWQGAPTLTPAAVDAKPLAAGIHLVDFPGSSQTALAIVRRGAAFTAPDYFEAELFNRVLGGAFTSRINMNLREDKGYTYGSFSTFVRRRLAGAYVVGAGVKADTTAASIAEVFKEFAAMVGDRPITDAEFADAKRGMLLGFPGRFEQMGGVAEEIAVMPTHGLPADWLARWPERVQAVTKQAAMAAAAKTLDPAAFAIVVAGPRAVIEPQLQALGMPITTYDAQGVKLATPAAGKRK